MTTKGIYTIARIVVFKDEPLATARHDLAVKSSNGEVWHNRKGLAWTDPFSEEVRDYNIDVAVEAAKAGFDEIQFDYVRFPDARCLMFSAQDLWRPLLAIAEAVGGDWTDRARRAAVELAGIQPEDNSLGVQLLARIQLCLNASRRIAYRARRSSTP